MPKKKASPASSFRSIQILGERAQSFLHKARERMKKKNGASERHAMPSGDGDPGLLVSISTSSVARATLAILAIGVAALLIFFLRDKLIILFLAFFVAIVMDPTVRYLEGWGVPRGLAVVLVYLLFLSLAVFLIASLIPIVAVQIQNLARLLVRSVNTFLENPTIAIPFLSQSFNADLTNVAKNAIEQLEIEDKASSLFQIGEQLSATTWIVSFAGRVAGGVVNFVVSLILVLVLAFFIQLEKEKISEYFRLLFPRSFRSYLDTKTEAIHHKMGQWAQGQLILCVVVGTLVFVALYILDMREYAVTLGLLAGFTEFIPAAGPIIAAVPAILIALTEKGLLWGVVIAGVYYAIQWCENNLLVPLIMKRAVGLSPIAILFAMMVGISFPDTIHPIIGIIISVPVTTIITLFIRDWQEARRRE